MKMSFSQLFDFVGDMNTLVRILMGLQIYLEHPILQI